MRHVLVTIKYLNITALFLNFCQKYLYHRISFLHQCTKILNCCHLIYQESFRYTEGKPTLTTFYELQSDEYPCILMHIT
jgi:hypothetical protein